MSGAAMSGAAMSGTEMSGYVLGVDGGGSNTRVVAVGPDGTLLGFGRSGPSNFDDIGVEGAQANVRLAVTHAQAQAQANAGVAPGDCRAVFLGMAGVVSAEDHAIIHGIAERLRLAPPGSVGVDHDCRIALAGGLSGRPGIVLIVGTGSSCYGRNAAGEGWMTGGRGHLIADEGSGYWLGIQAMRAAVMAHDGRLGDTLLLPAVLNALGIRHMDEVLHRLYVVGMSRAEIATLGPLVIEAARAGDATALDLLALGAEELARCVWAAARHLGMDQEPVSVCAVGGIVQAGPIVTAGLHRAVGNRLPAALIQDAELPPVLGAALLALEQAGTVLTAQVRANLQKAKDTL